MEKTKVIFRKFSSGNIIALFPEELGNNSPCTCMSYMRVGQHGSADPWHVINITKLAKEDEYNSLKKELESIGYDLQVIKRNRYKFYKTRKQTLKNLR